MERFTKKIFTFRSFARDTFLLLKNLPRGISIFKNGVISKSFSEKIMLAVTAVNDCSYCAWFHVKMALMEGLEMDQVTSILALNFHGNVSKYEAPALLYAQHYAETDRNPTPEAQQQLAKFYNVETVEAINFYLNIIYFGNLCGNTFDAFLSRLKGTAAENSNAVFEFFFFLISFPVLIPILPRIQNKQS